MSKQSGRSKGGQIMAERQRKSALDEYYKNPLICEQCGKVINVREHERVSEVRRKKFCSKSCAASFRNRQRVYQVKTKTPPVCECIKCMKHFAQDIVPSGFSKSKYCQECRSEFVVSSSTKGELRKRTKNYQSMRSAIRKHAEKIFCEANVKKSCHVCGYNLHVDICHIKSVSSFPDDALVSDINSIDNLIALCPNHHWEFDNSVLMI